MFAVMFGRKYAKTYQPSRCELDFKLSSYKSSLSLPISIAVNSVINHKLLDIFHRRCIKEKLTSPMRDLEEMLAICLSHNRRRCRVQDTEIHEIHFFYWPTSKKFFKESDRPP